MTTNYLESRCPIVSRCLRQLKPMVATLSFEDEDDRFISLTQALEAASAEPDIVRLRGFVAIEKLVQLLDWAHTRTYEKHGPKLAQRSWASLTGLKRELDGIVDRTILDNAEQTLAGVQITTHNVVILPSHMLAAGLSDFTHRVTAIHRVNTLATSLDTCINVLRPYLRNESVSVAPIGDALARCHMELYGMLAASYFIQTIQELLDVKL